jgi:hypothetical protein
MSGVLVQVWLRETLPMTRGTGTHTHLLSYLFGVKDLSEINYFVQMQKTRVTLLMTLSLSLSLSLSLGEIDSFKLFFN